MQKIDILAIGVHPDDVELACCGTLMAHMDMGYSVAICDLTQGELGSRGSGPLRLEEARKAASLMGVTTRENLGMEDGYFMHTPENINKIVRIIRKYQPEIIFCNAVHDRHPDHGRAAKLVSDACFYSGLPKIQVYEEGKELMAWRPKAVYHYIQDRNLKPDFVVDITQYMERKVACILAFESQFFAAKDQTVETPISSKDFFEFIYAKARTYGRDIQATYAEGFTVERTPGVRNIMELI